MTTQSTFRVIGPLVRRHAEDAAFYWAQHDASSDSPRLGLVGLSRFSQLLEANLAGLVVAGIDGMKISLAALERWKKPAEAFVATHTALHVADVSSWSGLWTQVHARPNELLRGVISALAWLPDAQARGVIAEWAASGDSAKQVAALRATALIGIDVVEALGGPLEDFLSNPNEHVRAAACRVSGLIPDNESLCIALSRLLDDRELAVRAEAAIALGFSKKLEDQADTNVRATALQTLHQCVNAQVAVMEAATGWYRKQAARRLNRWVQLLGVHLTPGRDCSELLAVLPPRIALRFIAYHGDPKCSPFVLQQMESPAVSQYAGWVWQSLTGVDLVRAGLSLAEPEQDSESAFVSEVPLNDDQGMARPDVEAIKRHSTASVEGIQRLGGTELTRASALNALSTGAQALRNIAACHSRVYFPHAPVAIRSAVHRQYTAMTRLQSLIESTEV